MAQVLTVQFANYAIKSYDYYYAEDTLLIADDLAIVKSPSSGWTLVKIISTRPAEFGDEDKHKLVLQVASLENERLQVKNEALREIIKNKLQTLQNNRTDEERYAALAAIDPLAAQLVEQLKALS